jgi:hypothetical protein
MSTPFNPNNTMMSMATEGGFGAFDPGLQSDRISMLPGAGGTGQASLCFIIQNEKEVMRKNFVLILAWRKIAPMSTLDLNEYVAIKFTS